MATATLNDTVQLEMDKGQLGTTANCVALMRLGSMNSLLKVTVAGYTAAATIDLTDPVVLALATVNVGYVRPGENLPAIGVLKTLQVTGASANTEIGSYVVTDAAGTTVAPTNATILGVATITDDGKTLGFSGSITDLVIEYYPVANVDMTSVFETQG